MCSKIVILCLAVAIYGSIVEADVDCSMRPPPQNIQECCPMPIIVTDEMKEKCQEFDLPPKINEDNDSRPRHPRPPHNPCFMECLLNETAIIDADYELNEDNLNEYLTTALTDTPDMIPVVEESFKTCNGKHQEFKNHMLNNPRSGEKRMPARPCRRNGFLIGCVMMQSFKNCAPSLWSNSDECNEARDFMQNCKPKHGRYGGPRH